MICFQERLTKKMIKLSLIRSLREIAEIWEVKALGFDKFIGKIKFHIYWKLKSCHLGHKTFTLRKWPLQKNWQYQNKTLQCWTISVMCSRREVCTVQAVKHYWGLRPPSVGPPPVPAWLCPEPHDEMSGPVWVSPLPRDQELGQDIPRVGGTGHG